MDVSPRVVVADLSPEEWARTTLCHAFLDTVRDHGSAPAFHVDDGSWSTISFAEYGDQVARTAGGLRELGVARGDRVLMLMRNRPAHHITDLACLYLGAVPISLYFSSPANQLVYLANHSRAVVAVADDSGALDRLLAVASQLSTVRSFVVADGEDPRAVGWQQLLATGTPVDLAVAAAQVEPADLATLVYTSGTTGTPKAVPVAHRDALHAVARFTARSGLSFTRCRAVSYGPLAHSGERCFTHWTHVMYALELTDCAALADLPRLVLATRPHLWFGGPRLWEKQREQVVAAIGDDPAFHKRLDHARSIGLAVFRHRQDGSTPPPELTTEWQTLHEDVVIPALATIGLDEVIVAISGSAPMPADLQNWWIGLGIDLSDAYGMSETMIVTWDPHRITAGTAGTALPGMTVRLDDDGQILARGPFPFPGYVEPEDGVESPVDADGWFRTGDLGEFDAGGNLRIVDRCKDIIVPSSGHNVSPVALEAGLVGHPLIGQACVVGDGRPYCGALVVLDPVAAPAWAAQKGLATGSAAELAANPEVVEEIRLHIAEVNTRFARAEGIGAFAVVADPWLPDSAFLTPTAKLRRRAVRDHYAAEIGHMFAMPDLRVRV